MSAAFKALKDVSVNFENELRQWSSEMVSAKRCEKFEEFIAKKIRDMNLYSSKLKLLRAKPLMLTTQLKEQPRENALHEYGDTAVWKLLEHVTVKSLTQNHAVKALIATPNSNLDPELIERKEAIIDCLSQYHQKDLQLDHLGALLKEREAEHAALSAEWDKTLGTLQDLQDHQKIKEFANRGPLYLKLSKLVERLELMRWLVGCFLCARGHYNWLDDPHCRLEARKIARVYNTVDMFTDN